MNCDVKQKWTSEEKQLFASLIDVVKNNYRMYERYFPDRSYTQIKSQYHNFRNKAKKLLEASQVQNSSSITISV